METTTPLLLDARAAAARLNISHTWLKKAVTAGAVQHTRIGRLVRFSEDDLRAFITSRCHPPTTGGAKALRRSA